MHVPDVEIASVNVKNESDHPSSTTIPNQSIKGILLALIYCQDTGCKKVQKSLSRVQLSECLQKASPNPQQLS